MCASGRRVLPPQLCDLSDQSRGLPEFVKANEASVSLRSLGWGPFRDGWNLDRPVDPHRARQGQDLRIQGRRETLQG